MNDPAPQGPPTVLVDDEVRFTFAELCRACGVAHAELIVLVEEGVLEPSGHDPEDWTFAGSSLRRARAALRLGRDLELGAGGVAVVLDLLDEIDELRAQLRRAGLR
jgi:chaperone modulatory protein CbpM